MAQTVPPPVTPGRLDGQAKVIIFVGADKVASASLVPTRTEMNNAAVYDVTKHLAPGALTGFTTSVEKTAVPTWAGTGGAIPQTVSGPKTISTDNSIAFKASIDGVDVRDFIDEGDIIYLEIMPGGDVEDYFGEVWKLRVTTITPTKDTGDFRRVMVEVDILGLNERALIPAPA